MLISILIIVIVFFALSLLILGHEAGHFLTAKIFNLKVEEFGFGFPPRAFARKKGETEYSINWLPFGGFVKIAGESGEFGEGANRPENILNEEKTRYFRFQPAWRRFLIIFSGVFVNFLIGWILLSVVLMVGAPQAVVVTGIQTNSPAATSGFKSGDVILGYSSTGDLIQFINQHRGQEVTLRVRRDGRELSLSAVPRIKPGPNEGALGVVLADAGTSPRPFLLAISEGLRQALLISQLTVIALYEIIKNLILHGSLLTDVVGPVGIFAVAEQTGQIGLIYLVQLVSLISLNLAVINLAPFPALDGGRIFLILVEKIKGSPLSPKIESWINGLGFALLISLIVLITFRDVARLF